MITSPTNLSQTRLILIGAAVMLSLGMGLRQSFGLFLTPVTRDLALTATDFTLAVAVQNIVWGISQAPIGAIADRLGLRATMMAGAAIYVIGLAVMAAAGGAPALIVSGVLIGVALSCVASSLAMTAVARAVPEDRRSQTLGVVAAAGSLGTLLIPLATQALLAHQAWRIGALFFLALAAAMLPAAFCAGGADRMPGRGAAKTTMREMIGQAARHRPFLVYVGSIFCLRTKPRVSNHASADLPSDLRARPDAERRSACGNRRHELRRLAGRRLARRAVPEAHPAGLLYILRAAVFTAYFVMPPTPASTLVFAAAMGMLWLSVAPLVSGLVAEMFGTRYMATLLGIAFVMHQVGSSLGAWGGGLIFDITGSYDRAWQIGVLIGFTAGVVQIFAGGPTRRRDRLLEPRLAAT